MKRGKNAFALGFLLWVIIVTMTVVHSAEISNNGVIYLNYGKKIACDEAWIASKDIIRCKRGDDKIVYLTSEVDIKKTFGINLEDWLSTHHKKLSTENSAPEEPKTLNTLYLKDGAIINCDIVWQGLGDNILCRKRDDIIAHNTTLVDLKSTFGEALGKKIGIKYERRAEQLSMLDSLPNMAFDSDNDEFDVQSQGSIDQRTVELEIRRLEEKIRYYNDTCISKAKKYAKRYPGTSKARPKTYTNGNYLNRTIEGCKNRAKKFERELEELKNDPEYYFYKKNLGNLSNNNSGKRVDRAHTKSIQESKPKWLHDPFTGNTMPRTGRGYTDPRTGTFYVDSGGGVVNTRTGKFIPTH